MRSLVLISLLCAALAFPRTSLAQGVPDEARILYDQGLKLYDQGNYTAAIQLWEKTYALTPLPAILHNIAKAQEEKGDPKSALATWRRYLDVAPSSERAAANARIAALEIVVAALEPDPEGPASPPDSGNVAVVEESAPNEALTQPPPSPTPPKPERGPRSYRGLAVALMGVGATGAVVGGSVLTAQARGRASDAATSGCVVYGGSTLCEGDASSALSSGRLQFVLGSAIIGSGVALGAGSVLVAVRPSGGADLAFAAEW